MLSLFQAVKSKYKLPFDVLTKHQEELITHVLNKQDAFGVLPTRYGKSVTFYLPPLLLHEVCSFFKHFVV